MAIKNINTLVDKYSLSYLENSDYITKYYNEALANLGQRNTEELLLKYNSFTFREILKKYINNIDSKENNSDDYIYNFLVIKIKDDFDIIKNYYIVENYNDDNNNIKDAGEITNIIENINEISNEEILFNRKLGIVQHLCKHLVKDIEEKNNESIGYTNEEYNVFIPLDYKITYVCNGINEMILYYGYNDLYVHVLPTLQNEDPYVLADTSSYYNIIFTRHVHQYIKTIIYNYNFYEDETTGKYEVNLYKKFILPYIDENNIWQVNSIDTGICAKGKDALELNIITIYQNFIGSTAKLEVLSGLSKNLENTSTTAYPDVYIKRGSGFFRITCHLPNIDFSEINNDNDINNILKNSTVLLICPIKNFLDHSDKNYSDILKEYGEDGLITTIWKYNESKLYAQWEYLSIERDSTGNYDLALDFNRLTNFDALINYRLTKISQVHPDNFVYRHLIFENSIQNSKHQTISTNPIYGVIQNTKGIDYNDKYVNNLNLSFRFLNTLEGTPSEDITNIYNTNSSKYLKFLENSNYITNSLYFIKKDNMTNYFNEFIPNYNVPMMDLSEVLLKDPNSINKQNILSFDSHGKIYYSYFGTSFDDVDKSIVRLGTSKTNVNLGTITMVDNSSKNKFNEHSALSIDFPCTYINGITNISNDAKVGGDININGDIWNNRDISSNDNIKYSSIIPIFKYIGNKNYYILELGDLQNDLIKLIGEYTYNNDDIHLYFNIILKNIVNNIAYYYKYNDLIYIPALLKKLGIIDKISKDTDIRVAKNNNGTINKSSLTSLLSLLSDINIESDSNQIIYYLTGTNKLVPIFFVSSDNKLSKNISIDNIKNSQNSTNLEPSVNIINKNSSIFFGNQLDIILYNEKIIINEHKTHKLNSIWKLPSTINT